MVDANVGRGVGQAEDSGDIYLSDWSPIHVAVRRLAGLEESGAVESVIEIPVGLMVRSHHPREHSQSDPHYVSLERSHANGDAIQPADGWSTFAFR